MPADVGVADRPTARQARLYRLLLAGLLADQHFPTWRGLCNALGFSSPNGLTCHVRALERRGLLARQGGHFVIPGVRLEVVFEDSEAGRRAKEAWEGGVEEGTVEIDSPTGEGVACSTGTVE